MRAHHRLPGSVTGASILFLTALLAAGSPALAFDTGHHSDLTASAMVQYGFDETPIKVVQVANWLTDYYSQSPTSRDAVQAELEKLHFDNLYDAEMIAEYWGWLLHNTRAEMQRAAESDDPLAALSLMGLTLHAAQDFYSHSNWVETHPREPDGPYRRETWLAHGPPEAPRFFTGTYPPHPTPPPPDIPEHGGYDDGQNKDSHVRPLWDEAYVFAFFATNELLALMQQWVEEVKPGFWRKLQGYSLAGKQAKKLERDVEAAYKLSMWVKGKGSDGHWKGDKSGSARYMSKYATRWTAAKASIFVQQIKKERVHEALTAKLYSGETPLDLPEVTPFPGEFNAILVHTTHVEEKRAGGGRIDPGGQADLQAAVTLGSQRYVDRVLRSKRSYVDPWVTLHLAPASRAEIPLRIEVWDQDAAMRGGADVCDINPAAGEKELDFLVRVADDRLSGDVEGCHNTPDDAVEISGAEPDRDRVVIRFFVDSRKVESL
jgi:hypothetical protein